MATTFDGQGLGGFDIGLNMENLAAELLAFGQTAEGKQWAKEMGYDSIGGVSAPAMGDSNVVGRDYFDPDGTRQGSYFNDAGQLVSSTPAPPDEPPAPVGNAPAPLVMGDSPDARNTIKAMLATYGLEDLSDVMWQQYTSGLVDITNERASFYALRDQPSFKKRFAANETRLKNGLGELTPADYVQLEDYYRSTLQSNGLPPGFYDSPDDFQKLIENDVSPAELQTRVQKGYRAVAQADPEVKRQMQELYGVSEGQLAAYFLDPQRAVTLLERQAQAANIAARGMEQGGIQVSGQFAENLAARGVTPDEALRGFGQVGQLGELTQTFAGETALSGEQLAGAAFGIDVAAQQELERRKRLRTGEFAGGGSFARTTGETSGSISTSVGKAQ